ncbi:zinc finger transcription factor ace1 [Neofusicoccum parvum]|uniref:Zinc finger transcription factor ace1 n=1 Tax=Neofusicoccum parvum TaxID=310453 RepID=A0ACB5RXX2_9PEZI|nr:zinc finger transcription factor ace1 [Neofusicoccum parvum]GME54808.1 zinc finger transcription factor ace1 [Neofusicoccum parvum]
MASTNQMHHRRRPQKPCGSSMAPPSLNTHNLRKSGTFHSPTNDLVDPIAQYCSMPKRSETNPQSLEQILLDAGEKRISNLLASFDNVLAGKTSSDAGILTDNQVLPVPSFMLDNHAPVADPDMMELDVKPKLEIVDHHHASDSGLGSSVSGSIYDAHSARRSVRSSATTTRSAVTKSYSGLSNNEAAVRSLSEFAIKHIQKRIVKPILQEAALKEFHPLVKDVPRRIGAKEITNLRDLEKTLIFLAPEYATSPAKYLQFCETSVTFIATTVGDLCEADQRLPTDRPYTNNYFLDLVEQIRRYAAIMAATREKEASGEALDEMDYARDEKIILRGGLSHDGKPAELVRERNGKVIPIATESERSALNATFKRPLDVDEDDMDEDSVHRSMARRRKSERPGDVMHVCADCKKEFKRPCDLTKHEKTHSRPWKCPEAKCKYHNQGWPTEKERDRHVNDKHTTAPPQYKCLFAPCAYASKRESNCKQHMEKAHGWTYVRSKANGKGVKKAPGSSASLTPSTPLTPFMQTPASAPIHQINTPMTPFDNSPAMPSSGSIDFEFDTFGYGSTLPMLNTNFQPDAWRRESITTAGTEVTGSSSHSPAQPTSFEDAITTPDTDFNHSADNLMFDANFNFNSNFQQPTPALSHDDNIFADHFPPLPMNNNNLNLGAFGSASSTHLSPGAQPDLTLYSPATNTNSNMHLDEGFGGDDFLPSGDFTLFDSTSGNASANNNGEGSSQWFQDLSNFGGQFDNTLYQPDAFNDMAAFDFPQPQ